MRIKLFNGTSSQTCNHSAGEDGAENRFLNFDIPMLLDDNSGVTIYRNGYRTVGKLVEACIYTWFQTHINTTDDNVKLQHIYTKANIKGHCTIKIH